jgi:O-antigen ligase
MSGFLTAALRRVLVPLLLLASLLLPYVGGDPLAYPIIVVVLLIVIAHFFLPKPLVFDPASGWFLASFVLIAIVFVITNRPGTSDAMYTFNFSMFVLFAPLTAGLLRVARPGNARWVADLALLGVILSLGFALYQVYGLGEGRAAGLGSNAIRSATATLFLGFLTPIGFMQTSGPRRWIYLLGPIVGMVIVYLSGSRGPFLALLPLLAVALLVVPKRRGAGIAALAVIAVVGVSALLVAPHVFGRFGTLPQMIGEVVSGKPINDDVSGNIRYRIFQGSADAFVQSPWIGYGWGAKTAVVDSFLTDKVFGDSPKYHLHSDILDFGVSGGVVGLLAYLLVLIAPIAGALKSPRDGQFRSRLYGSLILVVGYACCGAINLMFGFELMTTLYVCFAAILLGYCRDGDPVSSVADSEPTQLASA